MKLNHPTQINPARPVIGSVGSKRLSVERASNGTAKLSKPTMSSLLNLGYNRAQARIILDLV